MRLLPFLATVGLSALAQDALAQGTVANDGTLARARARQNLIRLQDGADFELSPRVWATVAGEYSYARRRGGLGTDMIAPDDGLDTPGVVVKPWRTPRAEPLISSPLFDPSGMVAPEPGVGAPLGVVTTGGSPAVALPALITTPGMREARAAQLRAIVQLKRPPSLLYQQSKTADCTATYVEACGTPYLVTAAHCLYEVGGIAGFPLLTGRADSLDVLDVTGTKVTTVSPKAALIPATTEACFKREGDYERCVLSQGVADVALIPVTLDALSPPPMWRLAKAQLAVGQVFWVFGLGELSSPTQLNVDGIWDYPVGLFTLVSADATGTNAEGRSKVQQLAPGDSGGPGIDEATNEALGDLSQRPPILIIASGRRGNAANSPSFFSSTAAAFRLAVGAATNPAACAAAGP